eukprot:Tbor_TRINITY_DN4590_c0_g1::TRINITY_DN4590_c0_g1_i1::g.15815::m.15815
MFRLMKILCAEKATPNLCTIKLPGKHAIEVQHTISRIIAPKVIKFGTLSNFDHILKGKDVSPTAATAAHLGRAIDIISRGMPKAALVDIDAVIASAEANDQDFAFFAKALRLKAHNKMLDNAEGKMMMGSTNEIEVSDLRSEVRADIEALSKCRPNCWLVALAKAEFVLVEGHYEQAIDGFNAIINTLHRKIRESGLSVIDDSESVHPACIVAYQLQRGINPSKETLVDAKKKLGVTGAVVDEYVYGLCEVVDAAFTSHHMVEYFPIHEEYNLWVKSPEVEATANRITGADLTRDTGMGVTLSALQGLKLEKPMEAFHGAENELNKLLNSNEPIVPSELLRRFGTPGKITTSDDSYAEMMKSIESHFKKTPSTGVRPLTEDEAVVQSLLQQMLYRTQVSKAVALEHLEKIPEALDVLNSVISANKYLYMWKALSARGRMLKAIGKFEEADKDFKLLFSIKMKDSGYDVPRCDVNRTVSAF